MSRFRPPTEVATLDGSPVRAALAEKIARLEAAALAQRETPQALADRLRELGWAVTPPGEFGVRAVS